jgi:MFS superfamily sulfate permease-like transporter
LVLFRWDAPLFFANAELFTNRVLGLAREGAGPVRWLVVAAEPVTSVDVTSADAVADLARTLQAAGVKLCFAELKGPVKDKFRRFGLVDLLGEATLFRTIEAAVRSYQAQHAVDWRAPGPAVDPAARPGR